MGKKQITCAFNLKQAALLTKVFEGVIMENAEPSEQYYFKTISNSKKFEVILRFLEKEMLNDMHPKKEVKIDRQIVAVDNNKAPHFVL